MKSLKTLIFCTFSLWTLLTFDESCVSFKFRKMCLEIRLLMIFELFVTIFFQAVALFLTALLCICEIF